MKSEKVRQQRVSAMRVVLKARGYGYGLPDDDAGREYLWDLLLQISLNPYDPERKMRNEISVNAKWMKEEETTEIINRIKALHYRQKICHRRARLASGGGSQARNGSD